MRERDREMNDKKQKNQKKRSVLPIYAIGIVWLLSIGKLGTLRGILSCAIVSVGVFWLLRAVCKGKRIRRRSQLRRQSSRLRSQLPGRQQSRRSRNRRTSRSFRRSCNR